MSCAQSGVLGHVTGACRCTETDVILSRQTHVRLSRRAETSFQTETVC